MNCSARIEPNGNAQFIDNISEAAKRGAALTRQLLTFSRRQVGLQPRLLDLNESLKEVVKLLRPLMGDDVQIIVREGKDSAVVESDPAQLDQIVLNIAVNARDAMPKGGKLILENVDLRLRCGLSGTAPANEGGKIRSAGHQRYRNRHGCHDSLADL